MSGDFNVFGMETMPQRIERESAERAVRTGATRAALGHPAGRAWLEARLAEEMARPSYVPGASFDQVAYAEGRKALLREIARELYPLTPPNPEA